MGRFSGRLEGSRFGSRPGPPDIRHCACLTAILVKQAAPGNVSTRVRIYRRVTQTNKFPRGSIAKPSRAVVRGSRLFNTIFGLPRTERNVTRTLGTFQSGSPPVGVPHRSPITPHQSHLPLQHFLRQTTRSDTGGDRFRWRAVAHHEFLAPQSRLRPAPESGLPGGSSTIDGRSQN
jgi:hypothetical protein